MSTWTGSGRVLPAAVALGLWILPVVAPAAGLLDLGELFSGLVGGRPAASTPEPPPRPFVTGFNQGWLHDAYGSQWTTAWDEDEATRLLRATRRFGGRVVRMWLFEGFQADGVIWDRDPARSAWGYPGRRHLPTGVAPEMLESLARFLELCEQEGVQLYLTLFDGNLPTMDSPRKAIRREEWEDLLNDRAGVGSAFREVALAPVLEVLGAHPGAVFGLDLVNEGNALVSGGWFEDGWTGAARFVRTWGAFVRDRVEVPVTMSLGHHDAVENLLGDVLPEDAVDFYDLHVYDDRGLIPREREVRALARRVPVYLGEYGQAAPHPDDRLQVRVVRGFLGSARRAGLAGAFAWRLSDSEARFSFDEEGGWRPAAEEHRRLSAPASDAASGTRPGRSRTSPCSGTASCGGRRGAARPR